MTDFIYKFRSIENFFKFNELENQEIYFASLEELNDPMEGFKNIIWSGDEIVWRNLFEHYLLCKYIVYGCCIEEGKHAAFKENEIPVFLTVSDFTFDERDKLCDLFFKNERIQKNIRFLSLKEKEISRDELIFYLTSLNLHVLNCIHLYWEDNNRISKRSADDIKKANEAVLRIDENMIKHFNLVDSKEWDASGFNEIRDEMYFSLQNILSQIKLCNATDEITKEVNKSPLSDKNFELLISNFSEKYVERLETLIHPQWYTTCFTKNCDNAAVWGYYASAHKGVCLKLKTFNTEQGKKFFNLYGISGINGAGDIYEYRDYSLHEINYSSKYPKINFFNSLGQLSIPMRKDWLVSRDGNRSIYADSISSFSYDDPNNKHKQWSDQHLDSFNKIISTKLGRLET